MKKLVFSLCLLCTFVFIIACKSGPTADDVVAKMTEATGGKAVLDSTMDQVSTWDFSMQVTSPDMMESEGMGQEEMMQGEEKMGEEPMEGEEEMAEEPMEGEGMMTEGDTTMGEMQPMNMTMVIKYKKPNMLRMDFPGPDGNIITSRVYDGNKGWMMHMGREIDMSEAEEHEMEVMALTWIDGFMNYKDIGFTLQLIPADSAEAAREGNPIVLQSTDKYGNVQKFYINPDTYLIEKQVGDMTNFEGELEPMYMTFEDYSKVDGIQMPHTVAQYKEDGEMLWEATFVKAETNTGLDDSVFTAEDMTMEQ